MNTLIDTKTVNGVTYEIYDGDTNNGLSASNVTAALDRIYTRCGTASKLDEIANADNSTVKIYLDYDGTSNLDRSYEGSGVYKVPGDDFHSILLDSGHIGARVAYKTEGVWNQLLGKSYAVQTLEGVLVHEAGHIHDYRVLELTQPEPESPA